MKIRKAAEKDINQLIELQKEAKREIKDWILIRKGGFSRLVKKGLMYIAEEKKTIVGYVSVKIIGEEIILYDIYVKKEERRKGAGGKLIDKILDDFEKTKFNNITITCPAILKRFHDRYGHEAMEKIMRGRR